MVFSWPRVRSSIALERSRVNADEAERVGTIRDQTIRRLQTLAQHEPEDWRPVTCKPVPADNLLMGSCR